MGSLINAFSSLIHGLDSDLLIGVHFRPTYEEGIRIVKIKNEGGQLLCIYKVDDELFRRPPEQLEECYCFTKLELLLNNKVNRTLWDSSGSWKSILTKAVKDGNKQSIGWVTLLKLREDKKTPTEWRILEYRDTEMPVAGRYVLCHVYKPEKKNDSGRGYENESQGSNAQPDWVSNAATNPYCPNPIDDFDMELLDDESFNRLLLEFHNQGLP